LTRLRRALLGAALVASLAASSRQARAAEADSGPSGPPLAVDVSGCGALKDKLIAPDGTIRFAAERDAYQVFAAATTDRCRQAVERNAAPEITGPIVAALLRGASMPYPDGAALTAQTALCVLRPQTDWAFSWMLRSASQRTAPVCLAALADSDRPEAKRLVEGMFNQMFGNPSSNVVADGFVLQAAAYSPAMRARLRGLLPKARRLNASNLGDVEAVACYSADRTTLGSICDVPARDNGRGQNEHRLATNLTVAGLVLAVAGGAIAGAVSSRHDDGGLALATISAAAGSGLLFATVSDLSVTGGGHPTNGTESSLEALGRIVYDPLFGIIGGVAGGLIAYEALKDSSGGRVATTAVGAATAALCTIRFVWN